MPETGIDRFAGVPPEQSQVISCRLFADCVSGYTEGKHHILDLGPAAGGTVSFFSQFRCRLTCWYVSAQLHDSGVSIPESVPESIQESSNVDSIDADAGDSGSSDSDQMDRLTALFTIPLKEPLDLLLSWELFNYIDLGSLKQLVPILADMVKVGGVIHGISAAGVRGAMFPPAYSVLSATSFLRMQERDAHRSPGELYQHQLQRIFKPFRLNRTILLRNGLHEYVLVRQ